VIRAIRLMRDDIEREGGGRGMVIGQIAVLTGLCYIRLQV